MQALLERAKRRKSIQQGMPYGASLYRSGERAIGGFAIPPSLIAAGVPIISDILKRPINKFLDWVGLGAGTGSGFRSGDIPVYIPPFASSQIPSSAVNSSPGAYSKRDLKNIRVLEQKLRPLASNSEAFMKKLNRIHAKGESWLKKHRHALKHPTTKKSQGGKKYKKSKRYKTLKVKYYSKYPKTEFGKYLGSAKYKKHKSKYVAHHAKKKRS